MNLIYRLLKDNKGDELKAMVEEGSHHAKFLRIFRLLEDHSLEELIEARGQGDRIEDPGPKNGDASIADAEATKAAEITVSDLNYRLRKALKEPKRIFEPHQPYKKPSKRGGR